MLDQSRILFERGAEKRFAGKKHHHKLRRRFKLLPVVLTAESLHVIAHLPRMVCETRPPRFFIRSFERVEERLQRRFRIHHHMLAARQFHHQVRTQPSRFRGHSFLLGEIAMGVRSARTRFPVSDCSSFCVVMSDCTCARNSP